jgi:hypothetical protein
MTVKGTESFHSPAKTPLVALFPDGRYGSTSQPHPTTQRLLPALGVNPPSRSKRKAPPGPPWPPLQSGARRWRQRAARMPEKRIPCRPNSLASRAPPPGPVRRWRAEGGREKSRHHCRCRRRWNLHGAVVVAMGPPAYPYLFSRKPSAPALPHGRKEADGAGEAFGSSGALYCGCRVRGDDEEEEFGSHATSCSPKLRRHRWSSTHRATATVTAAGWGGPAGGDPARACRRAGGSGGREAVEEAVQLDLSTFWSGPKKIRVIFRAEKILPMTVPLDKSGLNFWVGLGPAQAWVGRLRIL